MKCLYFDIDGTILEEDTRKVKRELGNGEFERLVRCCKFDRVVCASNTIIAIELAVEIGQTVDGREILHEYCDGALSLTWLRNDVELMDDPDRRVLSIDLDGDWWYVDDLAEYYFTREGIRGTYQEHINGRVCVPTKNGDGRDVREWLIAISDGP